MPRLRIALAPVFLLCMLRVLLAQQPSTVAAENFPGGDLSARIAAADAALGSASGTITVNAPGTLGAPLTLHTGHGLLLRAPVTWSAAVTLSGSNTVSCESPAAQMVANVPPFHFPAAGGGLLLASHVSGITVRGCTFRSDQTSMLFAGVAISNLTMEGNTLAGLSLAIVSGGLSTGLQFTGNTVTFPGNRHSDIAAVSLYDARQVTATGNHFTRTLHGMQWWGGDSGAPGANLDQVNSTGDMHFTGNVCAEVGSCIWGSMGYGIVMTGNTATGCGDVCFDTEGGRDTEISGNTASGCANGCGAIFFFTRNTVFSGNHFAGPTGGGLVFIKNASQDPLRHQGVVVSGNTLNCGPTPCRAVYAEAASGIRFENNDVTNGTFQPVSYARSVSIVGNRMHFTASLPAGSAVIAAPPLVGGTTLLVSGNTVDSDAPQAAGSMCVAAGWSDFNAMDLHIFAGNRCGGTHPFPIGITTTTDGKNPGPRAIWILAGNAAAMQPTVHHAVTQNEVYLELPSCPGNACRPDPTLKRGAVCSGPSFGQLTAPPRGWATSVCANDDAGHFTWIPLPASR